MLKEKINMMKPQKNLVKLKKAQREAQKGNYLASISLCKKMINKENANIGAFKLLITNLIQLQRFSEVEVALKKTLKIVNEEESYALQHLLGCNYISQNNDDVALEVLEKLFNKTGDSKVLLDIALAHSNLGHNEAARDIYLKLIELEPDNHQAKFNLYPLLLYFQDYKNAWICFHSRLERQEIKDQVHWFAPQWSGESLVGKRILIYPEQGIGDNLSYTGCFSEAIADAKQTHIVCDNRLKGLYKYNFPSATVSSYEDVNREQTINGEFDFQILAGSLPYFYRLDKESFLSEPKLQVSDKLQQVKASCLSNKKLKVGISWFHGRVNDGNANSMYLEELLPLLKMDNIEWVNLQFGDWKPEVDALQQKHGIQITHLDDCCASGDFEHYGALISSLDLVIAASNAALMLASRLGVKSWVFLPSPNKSKTAEKMQDSLAIKKTRTFFCGPDKDWSGVVQQFCDGIKSL